MKENIVLIGMPGAGKSTVGVVLAKRLGLSFLDSDLVIQEREGCILHEIIEKEGLDGFNEIENQVNASIDVKRTIIATGGSAVYGKEAMQHLHEIGAVFYLKLSYEELKIVWEICRSAAFLSAKNRLYWIYMRKENRYTKNMLIM